MVKRRKIWYSDSEVENGLYTNGGELMTSDRKEYKGYYHKYLSSKEYFSGSSYNELTSVPLMLIEKPGNKLVEEYRNIESGIIDYGFNQYVKNNKTYNPSNYKQPYSYYPDVEDGDYRKGFINRYFLKKRNEPNKEIIEISPESYQSYGRKGGIDKNLYLVMELKWLISGNRNDTKNEYNGIVEPGVYDTNKRNIYGLDRSFKGIKKYLTNFLEFYKK